MLYFQRISFQIILRSDQLSLCRVAALKLLPVHRYSVVIFTFSGLLGVCGVLLFVAHLSRRRPSVNIFIFSSEANSYHISHIAYIGEGNA